MNIKMLILVSTMYFLFGVLIGTLGIGTYALNRYQELSNKYEKSIELLRAYKIYHESHQCTPIESEAK
jgi:hypothetical protein